ncbi:alpha/beta hydrolase [Verrucomicrobiales bacterium]|nr:alpha/beta hydrolase [Verrucomicrobiales bacterium]
MPTVQTNGITMHYEERGSGDPLLLIMGITAPGAVWEAHADDWSKDFRCIIPDNRGVGSTDKPEGPYTSEMMADDYAGLLDALGIEKVRVVGCSMGSIIAQQLCLRHPEKVQSSVLMCTWGRTDPYAKSVFSHMKTIKARLSGEEFMEYIQLLIFGKQFWDANHTDLADGRKGAGLDPNPQPLHGLEAQAAACVEHDVMDELKNVKCPHLVIGGEDDIFTPRWMGEEVNEALPDSEIYLYPGAGHGFHFERTDDFNPRVAEWLKAH